MHLKASQPSPAAAHCHMVDLRKVYAQVTNAALGENLFRRLRLLRWSSKSRMSCNWSGESTLKKLRKKYIFSSWRKSILEISIFEKNKKFKIQIFSSKFSKIKNFQNLKFEIFQNFEIFDLEFRSKNENFKNFKHIFLK